MAIFTKNIPFLLMMLAAAAAAPLLRPTTSLGSEQSNIDLATMVPTTFGDWRTDETNTSLVVNPEVAEKLNKLYSDTLTRTYINGKGERIMLSLAYGRNQNRELQVHKPEVCYVAQGFQIGPLTKTDISTGNLTIPVMRLTAQLGKRVEPITYWIRSGDDLVRGWIEHNKSRISAGLRGVINDGLLIRVSSISTDEPKAYITQELFIKEMLLVIKPEFRQMFLGNASNNT